MKQYIKSFALLLLVCLGFVACNQTDMGTLTTYPTQGPLGNWKSDYAKGDYDYIVSLSQTAKGDTICSLQIVNKETGATTNLIKGTTSYDPKTGLSTVKFDKTNVSDETALLYIAFRQDKSNMSVQYFRINASDTKTLINSFVASPVKGFEVSDCQFNEEGKTVENGFVVLFGNKSDNYSFTYVNGEDYSESGTFTWDYTTGEGTATAKTAAGATVNFKFSVNEKNQLVVATDGGKTYTMEREYQ